MAQQKVWFITGASRGFGRIWTEAALRRGDRVAATARDPEALADLVGAHGDALLPLKVDVTRREDVFQAVKVAHQKFGRLDVVVSNAGYAYMGAVEELAVEGMRENLETNLFGTLHVIQAALPLLRAQRSGHILTLSSIGGVLAFPTGGSYIMTKFAVEALSESLAGEVASQGIKVTVLEPGSFSTSFNRSVQMAPALPEYEGIRKSVRAGFKPEQSGDPVATAQAVLALVDSENPPLRLVLGAYTLPMFKHFYAQRLATWDSWAPVSVAAQGASPAAK